ncbi:hypothetical protein SDC9_182347 [bioreactor metagenome]|uniref:Uncharacterized protein n=1 Tax=bioreactor metagenome TaxID=1076179 RepID=A0A645HGP9_9ZZZZ
MYELNKIPECFGFNEETIKDSDIKFKFRLLEKVDEKELRKKRERELTKEKAPLSQSGISDYQKNVEDKIAALTIFLILVLLTYK